MPWLVTFDIKASSANKMDFISVIFSFIWIAIKTLLLWSILVSDWLKYEITGLNVFQQGTCLVFEVLYIYNNVALFGDFFISMELQKGHITHNGIQLLLE